MSPAANTPGTLVIHCVVAPHVAAIGEGHPEVGEQPALLGPEEAHRQQHEVGLHLEVAAGHGLERGAAVADDARRPDARAARDAARSSPRTPVVATA